MDHIGTQRIETQNLILRQFTYDDSDAMLRNWIADEKIQSMYSEPTYTTKEAVHALLRLHIFWWIPKIILQKLSIVLVLHFNVEALQQRLRKL